MLVSGVYAQEKKKNIIYETPTLKTLSQLYWALQKLDLEDNDHVDNFLMINDCGLYRDYANNEFEWGGIRESAKELLSTSRTSFPTHFELLQPLRFAEYEMDNKSFDVWQPYKIDAVRRFEVLSEDILDDICDRRYSHTIKGYPKGLFIELNRPFSIDKISVEPEMAEEYIRNQNKEAEKSGRRFKDREDLYKSREAYLVMKLRIFSYQGETKTREHDLVKVLAVLEGYEIYGDKDRELLLLSENFKRKKTRSKMEIELKKRYQERLKKQMEDKRAAAKEAEKQEAQP